MAEVVGCRRLGVAERLEPAPYGLLMRGTVGLAPRLVGATPLEWPSHGGDPGRHRLPASGSAIACRVLAAGWGRALGFDPQATGFAEDSPSADDPARRLKRRLFGVHWWRRCGSPLSRYGACARARASLPPPRAPWILVPAPPRDLRYRAVPPPLAPRGAQ